ncbi:Hypothetical protein PBC10988_40290 [Planctomycetales bacterium 10988]|nr:Hypothetical protein PBC10988_40290 [Planctomycetales bacterium 10988]
MAKLTDIFHYEDDTWIGRIVFPPTPQFHLRDRRENTLKEFSFEAVVISEDSPWVQVQHNEWSDDYPDVYRGYAKKEELIRIEDAVAYFSQIIEESPESRWGWLSRSIAWAIQEEFKAAISDISEVIRLEPLPQSYSMRAKYYIRIRDFHRALEDLHKIIELEPGNAQFLFQRGEYWYEQLETEKAIKDFTQAIESAPLYPKCLFLRGQAWTRLRDHQKALEDFTETIRLDPEFIEAYRSRAATWSILQEYEKAIEDCNTMIRLNPESYDGYFMRGYARHVSKNFELAIKDYNEAILRYADNFYLIVHRGMAYLLMENYSKAREDFNKVLQLAPGDVMAYRGLGAIFAVQGEHHKAIESYSRSIKYSRKISVTYGMRGCSYTLLGDYEKALTDFETCRKLDNPYVLPRDLAYFLAVCPDEHYRDTPRALELAEEAKTKGRLKADWSFDATLAAAHASNHDFEQAIHFQELCLKDPTISEKHKTAQASVILLYQKGQPLRDFGILYHHILDTTLNT